MAAKCNIHGQLFCKTCLIGNKIKEDAGIKEKKEEKKELKEGAARKGKPKAGAYQIRVKVEELEEQANFVVFYKRQKEGNSIMHSIGIVSILEK